MTGFGDFFHIQSAVDVLRILCGLFFIPHVYGKFFAPPDPGFFKAAGFRPPAFWMYLTGAVQAVLTVFLVFGIFTAYAAWAAAIHLAIAAATIYRVSGGKWLWNTGGNEYAVFWAMCCGIVAAHG